MIENGQQEYKTKSFGICTLSNIARTMYDNRTTVWKPQYLSNMIHVVQHLEGVCARAQLSRILIQPIN